ncbi:hypothetical protein VU07_05750, partial [Desulfobulbus sp. F4]|nr:hypothetical protein [Desulfobulbus sp. F4]
MSGIVITPSVTLPANNQDGKQYEAFKVWASIPVCDDKGITIDNVKNGDEITIYNAAGIASFDKTSMKMIKAIVGIANGIAGDILIYATDGLAAPFVEAWNKSLKAIGDAVGDSDIEHKRRDPYGKDPGTGDTGKHEGGLIVCMPGSGGAIYATDDYYFQDGA